MRVAKALNCGRLDFFSFFPVNPPELWSLEEVGSQKLRGRTANFCDSASSNHHNSGGGGGGGGGKSIRPFSPNISSDILGENTVSCTSVHQSEMVAEGPSHTADPTQDLQEIVCSIPTNSDGQCRDTFQQRGREKIPCEREQSVRNWKKQKY